MYANADIDVGACLFASYARHTPPTHAKIIKKIIVKILHIMYNPCRSFGASAHESFAFSLLLFKPRVICLDFVG